MEHNFSLESVKESAMDTGSIIGGMIGANVLVKMVKQDNAIGNGAMLAAGIAGAAFIPNHSNGSLPWYKILAMGAAAFGGLRLINIGIQEVTAPAPAGPLKGLAGFIPEAMKVKLREFIPSLSGDDTMLMGLGEGESEIVNGLAEMNLADPDLEGDSTFTPYTEVSGLGNAQENENLGQAMSLLI